ncbi:MAG TPA: glycosyltransferase [Lacunisphaera sp.]|nr:glycosyltransferase [Lacunisphaera sp.]
MVNLPRLLFLSSESPHTQAPGAIVFHRLLRDYPAERLLVVTNHPPAEGADRLACRYETVPLLADRLNRTRFWSWKAALRSLGGPDLIRLAPIESVLRGFRPEVVATLMQDSWYYDLAARFARKHRLPLCLFIHDLPHGFEPVGPWLAGRQVARDRAVYRQAALRLAISPGMAEWLKEHYAAPCDVLLPPRDDSLVQAAGAALSLKTPGRLTLGYAGGLHYGYGEQLLRMLPVLRETGTRLEYFGPQPGGAVAALGDATDVIRFNGYARTPGDAWRALLERCDIVLQPYLNPPGAHELQYRTHFPSKLGDCLSLGLPLLVTGPAFASGAAWCRDRNEVACLVTDPSPAALRQALLDLKDNTARRIELARRAQAAAAEFDAPALRRRFHEILLRPPAR